MVTRTSISAAGTCGVRSTARPYEKRDWRRTIGLPDGIPVVLVDEVGDLVGALARVVVVQRRDQLGVFAADFGGWVADLHEGGRAPHSPGLVGGVRRGAAVSWEGLGGRQRRNEGERAVDQHHPVPTEHRRQRPVRHRSWRRAEADGDAAASSGSVGTGFWRRWNVPGLAIGRNRAFWATAGAAVVTPCNQLSTNCVGRTNNRSVPSSTRGRHASRCARCRCTTWHQGFQARGPRRDDRKRRGRRQCPEKLDARGGDGGPEVPSLQPEDVDHGWRRE